MIILPRAIHDDIIRQANSELPNECCGYLAGTRTADATRVTLGIPMTNADASPEHFSFDPAEQFAAVRTARAAGLDLVANYHSHPETPARMSDEDIRLAHDTSIVYLIYSVSDEALKAFTVNARKDVSPEELTIADSPARDRRHPLQPDR